MNIRIDVLVLQGFAPGDRHRISRAVETELVRLIAVASPGRWNQEPVAFDRIDGGTFHVKAGTKPQSAGAEIARALFRSLRQQANAAVVTPAVNPGKERARNR